MSQSRRDYLIHTFTHTGIPEELFEIKPSTTIKDPKGSYIQLVRYIAEHCTDPEGIRNIRECMLDAFYRFSTSNLYVSYHTALYFLSAAKDPALDEVTKKMLFMPLFYNLQHNPEQIYNLIRQEKSPAKVIDEICALGFASAYLREHGFNEAEAEKLRNVKDVVTVSTTLSKMNEGIILNISLFKQPASESKAVIPLATAEVVAPPFSLNK